MKMDADMVVMTCPDLDNFHLKRSYVRKDIEYVYMFHYPLSTHMVLGSHALDHYFFTYRAQAATLMALLAVLAYSIRPSELRKGQKRRQQTKKGSFEAQISLKFPAAGV